MKFTNILLTIAVCSSLTSCFKDEPLNAECDIEQAYVHTDNPSDIFFAPSDTLVNVLSDANNIVFEIKEGADVSAMAPIFHITEGAKIEPASGSVHDFSDEKEVTYKVTSEDGNWSRVYNVSFRLTESPNKFDFENIRLVDGSAGGQFYEWSDLSKSGGWMGNWATGNPGFNLSAQFIGGSIPPENYPSSPITDGYKGKGVKLETMSTGSFGSMVNMGIAAGNLYIGEFDASKALSGTDGALQATSFGRTFDKVPLKLTGWYKYKSGGECVDGKRKPIPGTYDKGDIYAVIYRNHDNNNKAITLHGDDVLTSPYIVAIARVPEVKDTQEWTSFDVDFEYRSEIDKQLLADHGHNLSVVFTSSIEGASFKGALGSTLIVDEVEVVCEETTE